MKMTNENLKTASSQFPNIKFKLRRSGKLIIDRNTYYWNVMLGKWVNEEPPIKISSESFLSYFHKQKGKTEKATLILKNGGLSLAEIYKDNVVYRYGRPVIGTNPILLHDYLTWDVANIIYDGGEGYNEKVTSLKIYTSSNQMKL